MIKNKNYNIALFLCLLLPGIAHGMRLPSARIKPPKIAEKPIPKPIKKPTEKETTTLSGPISGKTSKSTTGKSQLKPRLKLSPTLAFQQLHASEWMTMSQPERIATKEMLVENGKTLIQEAKTHGLDVTKYESAIKLINNIETENIKPEYIETLTNLFSQLTDLFSQLEANLARKLVSELENLIQEAQNIEIKEETLEPFEKIAKEFSGNIADELLIYSKDEINKALSDLTQQIDLKKIETKIKATEKESAQKTAEEQKKQAETKKLQAEIEAAQQKAIEEEAQRAEEILKKEIDDLHKQIEKEETVILEQIVEDFISKEEYKKQLEHEQEQAIANTAEEERLRKEITETEAEMDQLERKREERKLEVEQLKQKMAEQEAALEIEINKETEAAAKQQELREIERQKELEIIKAESAQAQKKALEEIEKLETQSTEENIIKKQALEKEKNETLAQIDAQYNQDMQALEAQQKEVEKTLEDIHKKIEERKAEKPQEKEIKEETEEKKEKTSNDGGGELPSTKEYQREAPQEEKKEPVRPISPSFPKNKIYPEPIQGESKPKIAEVTPEITPEITLLPSKEIFPTMPELEYTTPQTQPTEEELIVPFAGQPARGAAGRWPKRPFSPYISPTQPPSFTPSIYGGGGAPSRAESIGGTNLPGINPYTQRIGLPPRVQPQEETPTPEIKREKKIQPQDIVWWEKLLPKWVVEYLGRKDRTTKEIQKVEKAPIMPTAEEKKPHKEEAGVVKTIIEVIKKPIADTINYIRGLFY